MTDPDAAPGARPIQVTLAGWTIAVAGVLLVVSIFDTMGALRSVEMREQLAKSLDSTSSWQLGLTVDQLTDVLHVLLIVAGVAAISVAILGIFVLQRHASARVVATVLAVPLVVTTPFAGGFWAALVACSVVLLWTRPARDWFAGRPPAAVAPAPAAPPPVQPPSRPEPREQALPDQAPRHLASGPPYPVSGPPVPFPAGDPTVAGQTPQLPPPMPNWGQPVAPPWPGQPARRPPQLRIACLLAAIISAITAAFMVILLGLLAVASDTLLDAVRESPEWNNAYDDRLVVPAMAIGGAVLLGWCLITLVLAFFAWRRHQWAWALLIASSAIAAVVSVLAFPVGLLNVAGAVLTTVLLLSAPVRAWFRDRPAAGPPLPPPPPGQYPPPPSPGQPPSGQPPVW